MSAKRKPVTRAGRGAMAWFNESDSMEQQDTDTQLYKHADVQTKQQEDEDLERATFYIRPEQHSILEELRIQLRKHHLKTNKSELVRAAIDYLSEQDIDVVIDKLSRKPS